MSEAPAVDRAPLASRWKLPVFDVAPGSGLHTAQHLDELEASAYQEGYARGLAEGHAVGKAQVDEQASRLRQLVAHMQRPLNHIDDAAEQALVELAIEAARRLVCEQIQLDPARVLAVAREALSMLPPQVRDVRVHAHPEDVKLLTEQLAAPAETHHFRILPDVQIGRGECRVQTEAASVDARLDARAAALTASLLGESLKSP